MNLIYFAFMIIKLQLKDIVKDNHCKKNYFFMNVEEQIINFFGFGSFLFLMTEREEGGKEKETETEKSKRKYISITIVSSVVKVQF